jgi:Ca2+-binding EF-hand superfamily protein
MSRRSIATAAVVALASQLAMAQMVTPAPKGSAPDRAAVEAAFARADINADGKLSKEEAARLPAIANRFVELDKDKDGFLSLDEFAVGYSAPA